MKKILIGILVILMLSIATVSANPTFNLIGNKLVNEGNLLEFDILSSAPDAGSTSFSKNVSFGTLSKYNETKATFSWTPDYDDAGTHSINFTVSDANSSDSEVITITVVNTNRAPIWTGSVPSQSIVEDSGLFLVGDVNGLAYDLDGDTLTFSIGSEDTSKVDCIVDSDGTDLKMQPASNFHGTASCSVRARDGSLYADSSFNIIVTNLPDAPAITSSAVTTANINETYSYDVNANDPDQDTLVYSLVTAPGGMTIDSNSGLISWTPNATGNYNVKVQVTDGSTTVEQSFTVTVDYPLNLQIYDLDVYVDGSIDESAGKTGGDIDKDVEPESEIKVKVKLKNYYTSSEDVEIQDIEITAIVEGMDEDGDDIEIDETMDDIKPGRSETVYLTFEVPLKVEEGDYDMILTIMASDERRDYDISLDFVIKVDKENHDIRISKADLTPETLICSRKSNLDVEIMNVGTNDEDSSDYIKLDIEATELGINFVKSGIELDRDPDDDENIYSKSLSIDLDQNFAIGAYPIKIRTYRGTSLMDYVEKQLIVEPCTLTQTQTQTQSGGSENVQVNVVDNVSSNLPSEFADYVPVSADETSFSSSGWYVAILVIVILGVLGGGTFLVIKFLIKPKSGMGEFNY